MNNPFDSNTSPDKYNFFNQITEAINNWMLNTYPLFDTKLSDKIERLEKMCDSIERKIGGHEARMNIQVNGLEENLRLRIDKYLSETYPDFHRSLTEMVKSLEIRTKEMEKRDEKIKKEAASICKSNSLFEDVYRMRDEMFEIRNFMNEFKKKFKKLFD